MRESVHDKNASCERTAAPRIGRQVGRVLETLTVAGKERVDGLGQRRRPPPLSGGELERPEEPDDVDDRRPAGRIVEVVESAGRSRHRVLLDMRIAMKPRRRQLAGFGLKRLADLPGPCLVDESEERHRRRGQPGPQFRRHLGDLGRVRSEA
jgi:hypothetical protein